MVFMDLALSRRLERTEGLVGASFAAVRQRTAPEVGSIWQELHGTVAIFDGAQSPMTQTFGLGLAGEPTSEQIMESRRSSSIAAPTPCTRSVRSPASERMPACLSTATDRSS